MRREGTAVLVTGGAGFIGSHLVRSLIAGGHPVRVLDNFTTGLRERLTGLAVELIADDVRDAAAVRRALDGVDVVFHLAGAATNPSAGAAGEAVRVEEAGVVGALNVLEAARQTRPRRVVIAGSGAVYGRANAYVLHEEVAPAPLTLDAVQSLAVEHYARVYGEAYRVPSVVLRIFRCFGPGEPRPRQGGTLVPALVRAALEGHAPTLYGDGRQTRDFVYVDNVVAALEAAGSVRGIAGRIYNVASGEAVSLSHLWRLVTQLAGWRRDAPEPRFAPAPGAEPDHVRVSIARASRDLGYAPGVLLHEGLRRTLEHDRREWQSGPNGWFAPPEPPPEIAASLAERSRQPRPPASAPAPMAFSDAVAAVARRSQVRPSLLRVEPAQQPPLASWWTPGGPSRDDDDAAVCIELCDDDLEIESAVAARSLVEA